MKIGVVGILFLFSQLPLQAEWTSHAPRDEISPVFEQKDCLLILSSPDNPGVNGHFRKSFSVEGGKPYQFDALRKAIDVEYPRRSCVVRIEWQGKDGRSVITPESVNPVYFGEIETRAKPEYPVDVAVEKDGWTRVEGKYLAPRDATSARVQVHLRWTKNGKVTWKDVRFAQIETLPERKVVQKSEPIFK